MQLLLDMQHYKTIISFNKRFYLEKKEYRDHLHI